MSTDNLPDLATYQPTKYKTDGGFEPAGILTLVVGMAAAAILMGGIAYWVSQYFYLVLLFPIELLSFPPEKQQEILAQASEADRTDIQMFLDSHKASQSFPTYLDHQAKLGVRIGKITQKGSSLGYTGSIIYWILETAFVAVFVILAVRDAVGQPYCTRCHLWKENKGGFTWKADFEPVKNAFEIGRLPELAKSICVDSQNAGPTAKTLSLDYFECTKCHTMSPTDMFLAILTPNKHGNLEPKIKSKMTYPGAAQSDVKKIADYLGSIAAKQQATPTTPT